MWVMPTKPSTEQHWMDLPQKNLIKWEHYELTSKIKLKRYDVEDLVALTNENLHLTLLNEKYNVYNFL